MASTAKPESSKLNIPDLVYLFFGVIFLFIALFYLITPYSWQCELLGKFDTACTTPHWMPFVVSLSAFIISYFFFKKWKIKDIFVGKGL